MAQKPTIVLVSGGCHPSSCFSPFLPHVHALSYPTLSLQLSSLNPPIPSEATAAQDAEGIRAQILPLIEDGKDVVVLAHSMGGIATSGSITGLSKLTRAREGKKGGIIGAIFLTAILLPGGTVPNDHLKDGSQKSNIIMNTPSEGLLFIFDIEEDFYHDVPSPLAEEIIATLQPHAMHVFATPVLAPAITEPDFQGKIAYIKCTLDRALPPPAQEMMMQSMGIEWIVRELESSHSPFASMPDKLGEVVDELVKIFVEKDGKDL